MMSHYCHADFSSHNRNISNYVTLTYNVDHVIFTITYTVNSAVIFTPDDVTFTPDDVIFTPDDVTFTPDVIFTPDDVTFTVMPIFALTICTSAIYGSANFSQTHLNTRMADKIGLS